ncbi:hypothetical protein BN85400770 [Alteracholeplasma palmae J233]|uniref:Uncharacterized protein n=1 Tax=Alteracholeplasma palmae (strain ATCC 49389 / J233) TaxID=1318466 RepID=U4KJK1_ALTPJ|nr:hypothetical protein [Alteracholeplasma palmae]CCV63654.1 hypothetical protein BN85400770 [Alteracholeplasma palmae J233]
MVKSKVLRGIPGFICCLLIIPMIINVFLSSTVEGYANPTFMNISKILFIIGIVMISIIIILNFLISRKRKAIYTNIIKNQKKYVEGKQRLEKLLKIPQARLNIMNTYLYMTYADIRGLNLDEATKGFHQLKELAVYFKAGPLFSILPSYYLILIYYYLDKDENLKSEIKYFRKYSFNLKNNTYKILIDHVYMIDNNELFKLRNSLKNSEGNLFIESIIDKIERQL